MAKFQGTLWLADAITSKLTVQVDIRDEGTVVITARDLTIGTWPRSELVVEPSVDGIHIIAEGEELVFNTSTPGFVDALSGGRPSRPFPPPPPQTISPGVETSPPNSTGPVSSTTGTHPVTSPAPPRRSRRVRTQAQPGWAMPIISVGLAVAAVVLSLYTDLAVGAVALGLLATVAGVLGTRRKEWWDAPRVKGVATAGIALGIVAVSLGVMGLDGVNSVLDSVATDIGGIVDDVGPGNENAQNVVLQLQECSSNGATGLVINSESIPVDVLVEARFFDSNGRQVASGTAVLNEVDPGTQEAWRVTTGGIDYAHCRAEIQHTAPS